MTGTNPNKSVHQRLLNRAKETGRPFNELLHYYAMERFLYRLSSSNYSDKFILKGALMFTAWNIPGMTARTTRDIDLLGKIDNDPEVIRRIFFEICSTDVEDDGIAFNSEAISIATITDDAEYTGLRIRLNGNLGNARLSLQIDIGIGDIVIPAAPKLRYPSILGFPAPVLKGYSPESVIAEKLQAMVKLGMLNSRMKDFHDIRMLSDVFHFDGELLVKAVKTTFENRDTKIPLEPVFFQTEFRTDPQKQVQWKAFIRKTRLEDITADFNDTVKSIEIFIKPVLSSIFEMNSFNYLWEPHGPWKRKS